MNTTKWYALRVKGGREEKVKKAIEDTMEQQFKEHFQQIVLPFEKVYTRQKGKRVIKKRYLSYLFIAIDITKNNKNGKSARQILRQIKDVYGFLNLSDSKADQEPIPVDPQEIDRMLGKAQETSHAQIEKKFIQGETIKIVDGPLQGTVGNIKSISKEQKKLIVTIKIFKNLTEAQLSYTQVEKIE